MSSINRIKTFALDTLFPKFCLGCKKEGVFICDACLNNLAGNLEIQKCLICSWRNFSGVICRVCRNRTPLTRFVFAFDYKNFLAREIIHSLKYNFIQELAAPLSGFLIRLIKEQKIPMRKTMLIVPIPLHSAKLRKRGFNQSELIAKKFAEQLGLKVISDNLVRGKNTEPQIEFSDFKKRRENISGAFSTLRPEEFENKKVILIDDVSTSRSTLEEAARVLKAAGAKSIWGMVVARG